MQSFMRKFFSESIPQYLIYFFATVSIAIIIFIFLFVFHKAFPVIRESGLSLVTEGGFDKQMNEAIYQAYYTSDEEPLLKFGYLGLIWGTLSTTLTALVFATLIGIGAAVVICEYTSGWVSSSLVAVVRLLASVPSVVFGLIGIITVVPIIEKLFVTVDMQIEYLHLFYMSGRNILSAATVLTFMIVPMVISLSIDAINAVPHMQKETGYAFGMSKFRVIYKIILPGSRSGITAGVILGAGRGIGEAIAVLMVCGGLGILPSASLGFANLLAPTLPLASSIIFNSYIFGLYAPETALFASAALLLTIGAILSVTAKLVEKRMRRMAGYDK
ncbi:MAG: phosphate ABC transporter permease subunit PstC [Defluviitaleaceae bacterium]|nr:phosphate ABC transporter permease subunit PstC [Defluviitaleaceae bacterium]